MTRESGVQGAVSSRLLELPRLARFSLLLSTVTFLGNPSCLLTSTTEFPLPVSSPPFVDTNTALATPRGGAGVPITRILLVDDTQEVTLSTDVRADDRGRPLISRAFRNYKLLAEEGERLLGVGESLPPSSFDDVRNIKVNFNAKDLAVGCNQVALIIAHDFDAVRFTPVSQDDTAILVWWILKGDDPASITFGQCPGVPPSVDPDAGRDGGT